MIHHALSVVGFMIFAGSPGCFPVIEKRCVADHCVGSGSATPDWRDYFSFTRFAPNLTLLNDAWWSCSTRQRRFVSCLDHLRRARARQLHRFILVFQVLQCNFFPRLTLCSINCECCKYLCGSSPALPPNHENQRR